MTRRLFMLFFCCFALVLGSSMARAAMTRACYGPITLNSVGLYGPATDGFQTRGFDGDMTIHIWKTNANAISVQIQSTLFTAADDPTGDSFTTNETLTSTDERTLKGPLERVRFYMDTCGSDACLAKAMICGRISN